MGLAECILRCTVSWPSRLNEASLSAIVSLTCSLTLSLSHMPPTGPTAHQPPSAPPQPQSARRSDLARDAAPFDRDLNYPHGQKLLRLSAFGSGPPISPSQHSAPRATTAQTAHRTNYSIGTCGGPPSRPTNFSRRYCIRILIDR